MAFRPLPEDGEVITAIQLADDTKLMLQGTDSVPDFLVNAHARTAGQQLSLDPATAASPDTIANGTLAAV